MSDSADPSALSAALVDQPVGDEKPSLRRSYWTGAVITLILVALTVVTLDGGALLSSALLALPVYVVMILAIVARQRKGKATKADAVAVRWGFVFVLALMHAARSSPLAGVVWTIF